MNEGYKETLASIGKKNDIIRLLRRDFSEELDSLTIYSSGSEEDKRIEGRVVAKGFADETTDRKYLLVRDASSVLHYVAVGDYGSYDDLKSGSIVCLDSGKQLGYLYPFVKILSADTPEHQVDASKRTWLDRQLHVIEIGKRDLASYDVETRKSLETRKEWLMEHDLGDIQADGKFSLRPYALNQLDKLEVYAAGETLADKFGMEFSRDKVQENEVHIYIGHVYLETGVWGVTDQDDILHMAYLEHEPEISRSQEIALKELESGKFEIEALEISQEKDRERDRDLDLDLDDEMEL